MQQFFVVGVWSAAVLIAAVAAASARRALLRGAAEPNVDFGRVLRRVIVRGLLLPGIAFAVLALPFAALLRIFAVIHIAYAFVATAAPAFGVALLLGGRTYHARTRLFLIFSGLIFVAAAPICFYASFIAPRDLRVEHAVVALQHAPAETRIRVAVVADIQTRAIGDHERRAFEMVRTAAPDLILLAGDYLQCTGPAFDAARADFRAEIARLRAPLGVYAVLGDVDPPARTQALFAGTGVALLVNDVVAISAGESRVAIGGIIREHTAPEAAATVRRLVETPADARILLAHRPDAVFLMAPEMGIDLVVAGHTHGGQVVVPGFGPPLTLSRVPRAVGAGGLHAVAGQAIYVSRGVGLERGYAPPVRLFCPPEISLLELRGAARD